MNIVDIIILAILGLSLISGMYKGFLASGLTVVGFVASWFGAMTFYPQLSASLQANESLRGMLLYYLDAGAFFQSGAVAQKAVDAVSGMELGELTAQLQIPEILRQAFQENVLSQAFQGLRLDTLADYLGQTISAAALNVLSFLIMFALSYVVMLLVVNFLNHVFRFPVLRHLDWLLGGAFGLVRGVVVAVLIFSIVPLFLSMVPVEIAEELLASSRFYDLFCRANVLSSLI